MKAGYLAGNFSPQYRSTLVSLRNPSGDGHRLRGRRRTFPGQPAPPRRRAVGSVRPRRRAARTSRSASPDPARLTSPPPRKKSPATRGPTPRPAPAAPLGPHSPPRLAGDLRDGRRERLFRRGTEQQRLEKCQSQGQQAASSHLRDRRSIPPPSPAGGRSGAGSRGRRAARSARTAAAGGLARRAGARLSRGAAGRSRARKGWRADHYRAEAARRRGRLASAAIKGDFGNRPGRARRRSRSRAVSFSAVSSLIYSPDCRGEGGGGGGGRVTALGRGGGGCRNGGMAGGETCGRERLRLASPGKSEGGGCGWAAGGLGVRAVGRRRARSSPPYKAERNSQSRRRLAPAARRAEGSGPSPAGLPGDNQLPSGHPQAAEAPAEYLAYIFGGYFCTCKQRFPKLFSQAQNPPPA